MRGGKKKEERERERARGVVSEKKKKKRESREKQSRARGGARIEQRKSRSDSFSRFRALILQSTTAAVAHCACRRQRAGWIGEKERVDGRDQNAILSEINGGQRGAESTSGSSKAAAIAALVALSFLEGEEKQRKEENNFHPLPQSTHRMTSVSSS